MFVDIERPKQKYKIFLFLFTDTDLIMSRFTEEDFVSAGSFEYKAPEEVGCCIFDFIPAEMCEKNIFLPELPLFFIVSEK
jgi:hypothetical protein